jgi:hypothetical protein
MGLSDGSPKTSISEYSKADLNAPVEADIAALPSITKQQKALAEEVDEAARKYISGTLRDQLLKEIAAVEELSGRSGHFSVGFGFDPYRNKDALDVLVVGYDSAFGSGDGYVQAAVRIEGGARPDPVPVEAREIVPYVADELPNGAVLNFGGVTTVKPERTFWEKVLILHAMTEMTENALRIMIPADRFLISIAIPGTTMTSTRFGGIRSTARRQPQCVIWPRHVASTSSSCFVRLITDTNGLNRARTA